MMNVYDMSNSIGMCAYLIPLLLRWRTFLQHGLFFLRCLELFLRPGLLSHSYAYSMLLFLCQKRHKAPQISTTDLGCLQLGSQ